MKTLLCGLIISVCVVVAAAQQPTQLSGHVYYKNKTPARGVVLSIGSYSVVTDATGFYKFGFLKPGVCTVSMTPPGKRTRPFRVSMLSTATTKDFVIDW